MNIPATSTPWVPLYGARTQTQIPPLVNGRWAYGRNGALVWENINTQPGLVTPDSAWKTIGAGGTIPYENGWGDWPDVSYTPARFRKLSDNLVIFDGLIGGTGGAQGAAAFTMPVGYRPSLSQAGSVNISHWLVGSSYQPPWGNFWLYADGRVIPEPAGLDRYISLCNLKYYAGG